MLSHDIEMLVRAGWRIEIRPMSDGFYVKADNGKTEVASESYHSLVHAFELLEKAIYEIIPAA
jgi:hypothetical protein